MNIVLFGPNGSGKGTQGAIVKEKYGVPHVESGVIFRENIREGTALGRDAKAYMARGELVPDAITIPMMVERLQRPDCARGWLLDGFPRNLAQVQALDAALDKAGLGLNYVIEIILDSAIAKRRIMGRRLCTADNNHPNNIYIAAIEPAAGDGEPICRVCGAGLTTRADDQDEAAIDKRHSIYYDTATGTMAAVAYLKSKAQAEAAGLTVIELDGSAAIDVVSAALLDQLA